MAGILYLHGHAVEDSTLPASVRWGVGGAIAQKFAKEGYFTVLTTRESSNAKALETAIVNEGGSCIIIELDLASEKSISAAFKQIFEKAGEPSALIYNAGYLEGRDLPPEKELLEYIDVEMFDTAQHIASRGPFLVCKRYYQVCDAEAVAQYYSQTTQNLYEEQKKNWESLYYPRVMMRRSLRF